MILLRHAKRIAYDSGRGMALPGLYSGPFYSARSVRKAMGPLESPKSENPLRKQRGLQQGGDEMNERELPEGVL